MFSCGRMITDYVQVYKAICEAKKHNNTNKASEIVKELIERIKEKYV